MKYKCTSIPLQSDPYHPGAQEQVHVALFKDPEFWQVALHTINKILKFCSYYVLIVNVIAILVPKLHNSDCSKERSLPSQVCTKNYTARRTFHKHAVDILSHNSRPTIFPSSKEDVQFRSGSIGGSIN